MSRRMLPAWRQRQLQLREDQRRDIADQRMGVLLGFTPAVLEDAPRVRAYLAPGGTVFCAGCKSHSADIPYTVEATQVCDRCGQPCGASVSRQRSHR